MERESCCVFIRPDSDKNRIDREVINFFSKMRINTTEIPSDENLALAVIGRGQYEVGRVFARSGDDGSDEIRALVDAAYRYGSVGRI